MSGYAKAHVSEIPAPAPAEDGSYEWKPVRHHFGVRSFGANAMVAHRAGDIVVEPHTELDDSLTRHEELYVVLAGHAAFAIEHAEVDAPAGTFVYVGDPGTRRSARARADGTIVLALGGEPGAAFAVSPWERELLGGDG